MSDFKSVVETFRLSLYEVFAVLVPGLALILVLQVHLPSLTFPNPAGLPAWLLHLVVAFVAGYVIKGLVAEAAAEYRYRLKPWYEGLKKPALAGGLAAAGSPPRRSGRFLESSARAPWYIAVPVVRVLTEPLFALVLSWYVPWREQRKGNQAYFKSLEYDRVKAKVRQMYGLEPDQVKEWEYFNLCFGALPREDLQDRDRMDATADMLQGLMVAVLLNAVLLVLRTPVSLELAELLALHWVVGYALYNRVLRYSTLATRNLFRAFFHRYCRNGGAGTAG